MLGILLMYMLLYNVQMWATSLLSEGIAITDLRADCEARGASNDQSANETEIRSCRRDIDVRTAIWSALAEARVVLFVWCGHHAHARHITIG